MESYLASIPSDQDEDKDDAACYHLSFEEWSKVTSVLTYSEIKVLYYFLSQNPEGKPNKRVECRIKSMAKTLGMSVGAVSTSLKQLKAKGYLPSWVSTNRFEIGLETIIRNRLKAELGGLREVQTIAGRIDLLTETEIIEVKHLPEWKNAVGQVISYSVFYPEHRKRIHLFGEENETIMSAIKTICDELDILVTFEEVK